MKTFVARFVRPNGDRGVLYVLASSTSSAMQDVMQRHGPMTNLTVMPQQKAALFCAKALSPTMLRSSGS